MMLAGVYKKVMVNQKVKIIKIKIKIKMIMKKCKGFKAIRNILKILGEHIYLNNILTAKIKILIK